MLLLLSFCCGDGRATSSPFFSSLTLLVVAALPLLFSRDDCWLRCTAVMAAGVVVTAVAVLPRRPLLCYQAKAVAALPRRPLLRCHDGRCCAAKTVVAVLPRRPLLRCQDGRCCAAKTAATSPFVVAALS
jgi:hypothetical protein